MTDFDHFNQRPIKSAAGSPTNSGSHLARATNIDFNHFTEWPARGALARTNREQRVMLICTCILPGMFELNLNVRTESDGSNYK
ncbi:hypothetical protein ABIB82_003588 [Bradyrhizobium sp. i1.8.4]|uniref:hypothetical protein n=1 Tax=unclassified Bradyrhizobium TaxID=2631580 RepID=UPI003D1B4A8C